MRDTPMQIFVRFLGFCALGVCLSLVPLGAKAASAKYQDLSNELLQRAETAIKANPALVTAVKGQSVAKEIDKEIDAKTIEPIHELLVQAVAANPKNAAAYFVLAELAFAQKDDADASRFVATALQIDPTLRDAYVLQGRAELRRGEIDIARDALNQLTSLCGSCSQSAELSDLIENYDGEARMAQKSMPKKGKAANDADATSPSTSEPSTE